MIKNLKIGQRIHMVPNYGMGEGILGTVAGIERDEQDNVVAVYIQPPFNRSVYLDLRDEGFSLVESMYAPVKKKSGGLSAC